MCCIHSISGEICITHCTVSLHKLGHLLWGVEELRVISSNFRVAWVVQCIVILNAKKRV